MYYALVYYLESYPPAIDVFRQQHDPRAAITAPHLTLVFPLPASISEAPLIAHIAEVLKSWHAFDATFERVSRSWDDYVFLDVSEGREQVIRLHDALYTQLLAPFLKKSIEYSPHVTLGGLKEPDDNSPLAAAAALQLKHRANITRLHLIRCSDTQTPHEWEKVFELKE